MPSDMGQHLKSILGDKTEQDTSAETQQNIQDEVQAQTPQTEAQREVVNEVETPQAEQEVVNDEPQETPSWMELPAQDSPKQEASNEPSAEEKLKYYEQLMQDKELQLIIEAKKAGRSLRDVAEEYKVIDYSKMSAEDITKHYGQQIGLDEDQIEESIDSLSSMNPIQKHEMLNSWRQKLETAQASKFEQLAGSYRQESQNQQAVMQKFAMDLDKEASFIVDKELFGAKLTQKDADDFKRWVSTFDYVNSDGTYNVAKLRNFWLGEVKLPTLQKANYAKGQSEGRKEILKEVHRPSQSSAVATKLPEVKSNKSDPEKAASALKAIMSGKF